MLKTTSLGPLEQKILAIVWNQKHVSHTVNSVLEQIEDTNLAYTTVMTILNRLVEKGFLHRVKQGRSFTYQSAEQKQSLLTELIRKTLHSFAATFGEEALVAFAKEAHQLSQEQKNTLDKKLTTTKK